MKRQRLYAPFNEMQQMSLETKFSCCIWCNHEFTLRGFSEENDQRLHRVRRSLEHIIPESMFGRIRSPDVCKACNESFGQNVDPALLRDGSILTAAERAGLKLTELLAQFDGDHHTASGRPVKTKIRRGVFHPKPEFHAEGFRIAMTEGKFRTDDLRNAKAKMFVVVKAHLKGSLSDDEIRAEIDKLFRDAERNSDQVVFNQRIRQGLRGEPLDREVRVSWTYYPWETQWAVGKIAYEFSKTLWPNEYLRYCAPVLKIFRDFVHERRTGVGIFEHQQVSAQPNLAHDVLCELSPEHLDWSVTFFGTERWSFRRNFARRPNSPRRSYKMQVKNPFEASKEALVCGLWG